MFDADKLKDAMANLEEGVVLEILNEVVAGDGEDVPAALAACQEGMSIIGNRFETGKYFVADLIFSGALMTSAMEVLRPALAANSDGEKASKIILCTVEGDLHDIGKNIVKAILEAGGIEVVDLGIDVSAETIVKTAQEQNITTIALSGVLTLAIDAMKKTVDAFTEAGMRDKVKIIIGGAPINEEVAKIVGADAWGAAPQDALDMCRAWAAA